VDDDQGLMTLSSRFRAWATALVFAACVAPIRAEELTIFAAASLTDALAEAASGFEEATGHQIVFNLGASNDLARQIEAGARADLFFSADRVQMARLEQAGLVRPDERVDLLSNALVVVVPASSTARLSGPQDLPTVRVLAVADPQAVPAGVYARGWLEAIGLWGRLQGKVVPTLNVRAALAAVEAENADAGIVYRTDAVVSKRVKVAFEVPPEQGPPIVYPLARIATSRKGATADLLRYLTAAPARAIYRRHGFVLLGEK
jgi:molybdate transport system substrate-binding protein